MKKIMILTGLWLLLSGCSHLGPDKDGVYAFLEPNNAAELGEKYLLGRGVMPNNQKAFKYFLIAAKKGDPFAQNEVAYMYAAGKGVNQSYEYARHYYTLAAKQGLQSAQYNLGMIYEYGLGVSQDRHEARKWFHLAAKQGFEPAKQALMS